MRDPHRHSETERDRNQVTVRNHMPRKKKTTPPPVGGSPPSPFNIRHMIRADAKLLGSWRVAAATCGLSMADWIRHVLCSEAEAPVHVAPLKREEP